MGRGRSTIKESKTIQLRSEKTSNKASTKEIASFNKITSKGVKCEIKVFPFTENVEAPWELHIFEINTADGPAGYLKISNIPRKNWETEYPDELHYAVKHKNRYPGLRELLEKKEWGPKDYREALEATRPYWDRNVYEGTETEWENRRKLIQEEFREDYKKSSKQVDHPFPDFIRIYEPGDTGLYKEGKPVAGEIETNYRRKGLSETLYQTGAEWLAEKNLKLFSSGIQSKSAGKVWESMSLKGWVGEEDERKFIIPQ